MLVSAQTSYSVFTAIFLYDKQWVLTTEGFHVMGINPHQEVILLYSPTVLSPVLNATRLNHKV